MFVSSHVTSSRDVCCAIFVAAGLVLASLNVQAASVPNEDPILDEPVCAVEIEDAVAEVESGVVESEESAVNDPIPAEDEVAIADVETPAVRMSWFRRLFHKPSLEEVVETSKSPLEICRQVARHVAYRSEPGDTWTVAAETWETGAGDCEDFAILVQHLCAELGVEAEMQLYYSIKGHLQGHAIVSGEWQGKRWISSSGSFEYVKTEEGLAGRMAEIIGCRPSEVWSISIPSDHISSEIAARNSKPAEEQELALVTAAAETL